MEIGWFPAADYWLARWLFERLLGAIYFVAFLDALDQFPALLGEHGLLPAPRYLAVTNWRAVPTLFQLHYSDGALRVVAWAGIVLSALIITGLAQTTAVTAIVVWLALWILYLSIVNVGQTFYSFGWESLLLECGFLAIFLGPSNTAPPITVIWLLRWLLFRVEFGAGLIKLRHDPCWRDLTCLYYHHETQPLPNPLSWYFHHLPKSIHKLEVLGNHVGQLALPFCLFLPQPIAGVAGLFMIIHQFWLILSGNFAWLNWLTLAVAVAALDDRLLGSVLPVPIAPSQEPSAWWTAIVLAATTLIVVLSYWPARNLLGRGQVMNFTYNPFHLSTAMARSATSRASATSSRSRERTTRRSAVRRCGRSTSSKPSRVIRDDGRRK